MISLPVFPLPLAVSPGEVVPLHIFEERYNQILEMTDEDQRLDAICPHLASALEQLTSALRTIEEIQSAVELDKIGARE